MYAEIIDFTFRSIKSMVTGAISAKDNIAGPIGIFKIVQSQAEEGLVYFLRILGIISINLAIINLFPVIPLDGGHIFLLMIEKIRGRVLPQKIENVFTQFGFSLIMLLLLFAFYSDFARYGWFDKIKGLFP